MCFIDFDGTASVFRETERKARKAHRCSCCGKAILVGEKYTQHFSVFDGDASHEKVCAACLTDRQLFCDDHGLLWITPSFFPDQLEQCVADGDPESDEKWRPMLDRIEARGAASNV